MKFTYQILILLFLLQMQICFAQKVTNITAEQVGQNIQVSYNLETESPCTISLFYSTDNGVSWQGPLKNVGGDVGEKVYSGNKKITWDVLIEMEQFKFSSVVFKVDARKLGLKEVKIGNQIWSAENLNVDMFADGDKIFEMKSNNDWELAGKNKQPAWCYYYNNSSRGALYGKLYNWYAVADPRGLCPSGWHVPSDGEWTTLENYLGGRSVAARNLKLIGLTHWASPNTEADNSSGFTGLPGGIRYFNGTYDYIGEGGYWWSATQYSTANAYGRDLHYYSSQVNRNVSDKNAGFSVRCIKDIVEVYSENNNLNTSEKENSRDFNKVAGFGYDLSGRNILSRPKIVDNSLENGTVVITIAVDKNGDVISAEGPSRGSTTTSFNLVKKSKEAALKIKFAPSDLEIQKGTLTFRFFLR